MTSKIGQFIHSRYDLDEIHYGYLKFDKHANTGRLINFADIFAQIGRGAISTIGSLALLPTRFVCGLGGIVILLPIKLGVAVFKCLMHKEKRNLRTFHPPLNELTISERNLLASGTGILLIPIDITARVGLIAADITGIAFPQLGQIARNAEKNYFDLFNELVIERKPILREHPVAKFVIEHVWPRSDKTITTLFNLAMPSLPS